MSDLWKTWFSFSSCLLSLRPDVHTSTDCNTCPPSRLKTKFNSIILANFKHTKRQQKNNQRVTFILWGKNNESQNAFQ